MAASSAAEQQSWHVAARFSTVTSHRQIFRSSAIVGGASAANILISIVKVKVLAVLLGPAGVGLMGLYQNIMTMAATLAGCGMDHSGVRQLAAASGDADTLAIVRRTLWLGNMVLGIAGMALLWLLREPVAHWVFGEDGHGAQVGWLGLGVLLTLIAGSQTALLQGLRRIGDLARVNVLSALAGAVVGVCAVYLLGEGGVLWFVLTAPAVSIPVAAYFAARLPRVHSTSDMAAIHRQWMVLLRLGIPLMSAGLLTLLTQLAARSIVLRDLGLESSGYFQAAWAISMTYIGFVLGAMGADYYPRLTEAIGDKGRARVMVNEQVEMALLLAGPVLLAMITLAPWVVELLYAESFAPAAQILRWQVLGDIFKAASWPMGIVVLALGRGGIFIATQAAWNAIYISLIWFGIGDLQLAVVGVSFWVAYLVLYVVHGIVANRLIGFVPSLRNRLFTLALLLAGGITLFLSVYSSAGSYLLGMLATVLVSAYCVRRLNVLVDIRGWLSSRFG